MLCGIFRKSSKSPGLVFNSIFGEIPPFTSQKVIVFFVFKIDFEFLFFFLVLEQKPVLFRKELLKCHKFFPIFIWEGILSIVIAL